MVALPCGRGSVCQGTRFLSSIAVATCATGMAREDEARLFRFTLLASAVGLQLELSGLRSLAVAVRYVRVPRFLGTWLALRGRLKTSVRRREPATLRLPDMAARRFFRCRPRKRANGNGHALEDNRSAW